MAPASFIARRIIADSGRFTVRVYHWHSEQDASREGYLLDKRVSAGDLLTAIGRARSLGVPEGALVEALSEAEEQLAD